LAAILGFLSTHQTKKAVGNSQMILRSPGGGIEAFASGPFEGVAPEEDVEGAFFLLEEVVDVFLEVGGDLVQGSEGRRSFIGLEEGKISWRFPGT